MGDAKLDLLVYGASGHAKVIIDAVIKEGKHRIVAIIDDDPKLWKGEFCGYLVIGGGNVLKEKMYRGSRLILAIGSQPGSLGSVWGQTFIFRILPSVSGEYDASRGNVESQHPKNEGLTPPPTPCPI